LRAHGVQFGGDRFIGAVSRQRPVPGAADRVVQDRRQGPVRGLSLVSGGAAIGGRAQQGMTEDDRSLDLLDQTAFSASSNAATGRPQRLSAGSSVCRSPPSSAAASSSARRTPAGRRPTRARNDSSTAPFARSGPAIGSVPSSWRSVRLAGSSSNASGLPHAECTSIVTIWPAAGRLSLERSRARADASSRPRNLSSGSPVASNRCPCRCREAIKIATGSASSRRAANVSASCEGRSSQCASSIRHSTGRSSHASASRLSTPSETR
jgi:hypothetical protein